LEADKEKTGYARVSDPPGRSKVFPDCEIDFELDEIECLEKTLQNILQVPQGVIKIMENYSEILAQPTKKYAE